MAESRSVGGSAVNSCLDASGRCRVAPREVAKGARICRAPQGLARPNGRGRKVAEQSNGVTCLDCHANFHTNAAFHLTPDVRPQAARFRLDTTSLRGMFNQQ